MRSSIFHIHHDGLNFLIKRRVVHIFELFIFLYYSTSELFIIAYTQPLHCAQQLKTVFSPVVFFALSTSLSDCQYITYQVTPFDVSFFAKCQTSAIANAHTHTHTHTPSDILSIFHLNGHHTKLATMFPLTFQQG
jgi:hypothetical protein